MSFNDWVKSIKCWKCKHYEEANDDVPWDWYCNSFKTSLMFLREETDECSRFEEDESNKSERERLQEIVDNGNIELARMNSRKNTKNVLYSKHYHQSVLNRIRWAEKALREMEVSEGND